MELNKLYNMDCMEGMKQFTDKYFDLAIVDPPYGINLKGANVYKNKSDSNTVFNTEWDKSIPDKAYFEELMRVSKEQIIWGGNHFLNYLGNCKAPIIWDKLNGDSPYADGFYRDWETDRKSTRLNSSHSAKSRMPSSA